MVNLIPPNVFHAAASATKDLSRAFTPWSHAVALIYQQLTKTESLNGVCDAARLHASQWQELRGAVPPRRNTFSNANQHRDPTMMETLYWKMLDYLGGLSPEFVSIRNPSVLARFKKRHIHLLDSSTIQLVLNSIDWAIQRGLQGLGRQVGGNRAGPSRSPCICGSSAFLAVSNGTASRQILGDSEIWSRLSENLSRNFIP